MFNILTLDAFYNHLRAYSGLQVFLLKRCRPDFALFFSRALTELEKQSIRGKLIASYNEEISQVRLLEIFLVYYTVKLVTFGRNQLC